MTHEMLPRDAKYSQNCSKIQSDQLSKRTTKTANAN